jgi:O-6-methylguanine DNA methyltransferase
MIYYSTIKIPELKRTIFIAKNEEGICSIEFSSDGKKFLKLLAGKNAGEIKLDSSKLKLEIRQIKEYFSGRRKKFSMKLYIDGTPFQKKVWNAIAKVGYGKTASYDRLAKEIRNPKALRAVGTACGKNPLPIVIPCHRIISKNGSIGGFGGGIGLKRKMLEIEKVKL